MLLLAYLDTCIISGLAKSDLPGEQLEALRALLEARKGGSLSLVTSSVTKEELQQIPPEHRDLHVAIYNLLDDVPSMTPVRSMASNLLLLGVGGGTWVDPLFAALRDALPDVVDAEHVFQAAKNGVTLFITADCRTLVRHRDRIRQICGVTVATPVDALEGLLRPSR